MAKQYVVVDGMGQLATGPDWAELMAQGEQAMVAALAHDMAEVKAAEARIAAERAVVREVCVAHPGCTGCPNINRVEGCEVVGLL